MYFLCTGNFCQCQGDGLLNLINIFADPKRTVISILYKFVLYFIFGDLGQFGLPVLLLLFVITSTYQVGFLDLISL